MAAKEHRILTPEESDVLQESLPLGAQRLVETAIESGLRWSELTERRVRDLHPTSCILTVSRGVVELQPRFHPKGERFRVKPYPKGRRSRRFKLSRPLGEQLLADARAKSKEADDVMFTFDEVSSDEPVATPIASVDAIGLTEPNEHGRQYQHGTLSAYTAGRCGCVHCRGAFARYRAERRAAGKDSPRGTRKRDTDGHTPRLVPARALEAGVQGGGYRSAGPAHGLRHSHASWLLAGGAHIQIVKERLGHRSIATTEKYLHTLPDADVRHSMRSSESAAEAAGPLRPGADGGPNGRAACLLHELGSFTSQQTKLFQLTAPDSLEFAMTANTAMQETTLVERAVAQLGRELSSVATVEMSNRVLATATGQTKQVDGLIDVKPSSGQWATLAIEARPRVSPRDAEGMLSGQLEQMSQLAGIRFLVVAPWLSSRTREILSGRGLNYMDLTGNALIRLDQPPILIRTDGLARDPNPVERGQVRVRGPKAGRLIRLLVDVRPPYGVRALAERSGLTPGYVSRLLDALDDDALISRTAARGPVVDVDVAGLVRRYADSYNTLTTNAASSFVVKSGTARALTSLAQLTSRIAVTGSFAAARTAPVAAPTLLAVYTSDVRSTARALDLLPTEEGANVVLLLPFDPVVWDRGTETDGVTYVAPSQAALDCLAGIGRMPAEGEALLSWMTQNEPAWRLGSLDELPPRGASST